jgi:hypothetical protein
MFRDCPERSRETPSDDGGANPLRRQPDCRVAEHAPTVNPAPDRQDLERSRERFEEVLGR